ncbi:putative monooxygenase [Obba rivulosa]|uniref:Putative monooxygenase n=1 Tax=Obba rivulosa TaxID=1052685 RepID=A0A8E2ATW6_9APHY|nr:putative monooxygenase [Obba rivulosa]
MSSHSESQILIIGAGIAGLTLAQCLRQRKIPYLIFERDSGPSSRNQGWGLTLHWALERFLAALPSDICSDIYSCQVDGASAENDTGDFLFLDLTTLEVKYKVPPSKRIRVQREKLRRLLMRNIDIAWSKQLTHVDVSEEGIAAHFQDGSAYTGQILVGADGSQSQVRRCFAPNPRLGRLPVQMLGVKVDLTAEQAAPLQSISPLLFQGNIPETGTFLFVSLFDVEETPTGALYTYQLCLSYPTKGEEEALESVVDGTSTLISKLQAKAQQLHPDLQQPFALLPPDAQVVPIAVTDWDPVSWDGEGRITLLGDAAHAMTMFRGDGANQSIADVLDFVEALERYNVASKGDRTAIAECIRHFEDTMRPRARAAVLRSRQACLDAHSLGQLAADSPVVTNRSQR